MDCIFCKIAAREVPAELLYESDKCFVIKDIAPKAKVHFLAIPKAHIVTFNDITVENSTVLAEIGLAIAAVTQKLGIARSGYRVTANNGTDGGQEVPHLHFHVMGGQRAGKMI